MTTQVLKYSVDGMHKPRHALSIHREHRGRHIGTPQPGNPGYDARPRTLAAIVLPVAAGLLGLAVVLLVLYRTLEL